MAEATIRIPTPLRSFTGGAGEVDVSGNTVGCVSQRRMHWTNDCS